MFLEVVSSGSKGNCYILSNDEESLMIECGVKMSVIKQAFNFNFTKLKGTILTHNHQDHCKAIKDVLAAGIPVWASKGTHTACDTIGHHRAKVIPPLKAVMIGNFKIMAFTVMHDAAEPVGFIIQHPETGNILFITDTYYVPNRFENIHNVIVEANYCDDIINQKLKLDKKFLRDRVLNSHMSLRTCKEFLQANDLTKVNNIVLIHLSDSNSDANRFQKEIKELTGCDVRVAENGLKIPFDKTPF